MHYLRSSPTQEINEEPNIKNYTFSFCFFISSLQRVRQINSYFNYLLCEELFLYFTVEIAKTNNYWPMVIFIAVGQ
jgi:hypothetical protein